MDPFQKATFQPRDESVAAVRRFVRGFLAEIDFASDDVLIAVSELASNAVRHGRTNYTVSLEHLDGSVRVMVADAGVEATTPFQKSLRGGRGLKMVDKLASSWGVTAGVPGKTYWAVFQPASAR